MTMGLFDSVRCEYRLPDPAHQDLEFQTKDLDCFLDRYTITREGRLVRHANKGMLSTGLVRDVEWPIHGHLRIYQSLERPEGEREWVEYVIRFTDGRVERVDKVEQRKIMLEEPRAPSQVRSPRPAHPLDARILGGPRPALDGRSISADEFHAHTPEKLELIDGELPGAEELLMLLLTQVGLRRAAELVGRDRWMAVGAEDD